MPNLYLVNPNRYVDYDIHGLLGIRLIDPSPADEAAVFRQLGLMKGSLERPPDILIRFVPELPTNGLHYLGLEQCGFTNEGFFILRSKKKLSKVRIDFQQIGQQCEILCQSGLRAVPLLIPIVNLTLLNKGFLPVHASGFVHSGTGVLVTGWAKGGKTEALLSFASHGAEFVGDEWILVSGNGEKMYGIPGYIHLWHWHIQQLPQVRRHISWENKLLFKWIQWLDGAQQALGHGALSRTLPFRYLREAMPALRRQLSITMMPREIFAPELGSLNATIEKVFMLVNHEDPEVRVEPCDPARVVEKMVASFHYELLPVMSYYLAFKFAFPGVGNDLIEEAPALLGSRLSKALAGKSAYLVTHPYPFSFHDLYEKMRPYCEIPIAAPAA